MRATIEALRKRKPPALPAPVLDALDHLRDLEWTLQEDGTVRCPDCRSRKLDGHHEDCGLARVLRALDDEGLRDED